MRKNWKYHLLLFMLCWIWGLAFIAVKALLEEVSFLTVNLGRFLLASLALLPFVAVYWKRRPRLDIPEWGMVFLASICAVYGYQLAVNYGETLVPAGTASLVANTTPVFAALLAYFLLGEGMGRWKVAGLVSAMAGVAVITVYGAGNGLGMGRVEGIAFILLASFSWAVYTVVMKPLTEAHSILFITAYTILVGTLMQIPLIGGEFWRELGVMSASSWGWLLFLGLVSTALGYFIYVKGLEGLGASVTAFYIYLIPPISLFWGWVILDETLNQAIIAGTAMILLGLLAVGWGERQQLPGEQQQDVPA
jgi:drug/metabolite transporter (DMT)-like permease